MRSVLLFTAVPVSWVAAFSLNAYDLGFQGLYPRQHFQSVNFQPPTVKTTQWDDKCDSGNLFLTPRGPYVTGKARGPVITDPKGNLIWMDNHKFAQAMNFNVQTYKGEEYLTFWTKQKPKKHAKHLKNSKDKDPQDPDSEEPNDAEVHESKKIKDSKKPKKSKKSYVMVGNICFTFTTSLLTL